jgi:AcrR family transcriptional regulator
MSAARKMNATKIEILRVATDMFLKNGYTDTTIKYISDSLGISTGNLTFHYPTKEHLLTLLVEMLCDFQWKVMERETQTSGSSLAALCLELPAIAACCQDNAIARDFYLSVYSHAMSLDVIRRNDARKAQLVFGRFCHQWQQSDYAAAQDIASGIEYGILMHTNCSVSLEQRLRYGMDTLMQLYQVPATMRKETIARVISMDYRQIGLQILREFQEYVSQITEEELEVFLRRQ